MHRSVVLCLFFMGLLAHAALAQEWTRFRGPNGTGESETTTIPSRWTPADYNWKLTLPGVGHSSPVLWGNQLFILSADPDSATRFVLCYDALSGRQLWEKKFESSPHHLHTQSSYASSTPAADAERVYVAWASPATTTLMALTHGGDIVWQLDLGKWHSHHGFGTSPIVVDDLVILSKSQEAKDGPVATPTPDSFMMAFDRVTGKERWRTPRKTVNVCYSVPAVFEPQTGPHQLVSISTGDGLYALDLQSGTPLWSSDFFDKRTVSSPLVKRDLIFGSTGSGGGGSYVVAARSDGHNSTLAYKIDTQAPYVPSIVARGDLLFMMADGGIASCLDIQSGKVHWRKRIGGNYSSSPVRAGDKIFCLSMDGEVVVLAADKDFQELGRTSLGEGSRATPAIANGCLYLRTFSQLMSIGAQTQDQTKR
jgi:outer membrane protein assembly factor BamB